jgi:hypothetical protein
MQQQTGWPPSSNALGYNNPPHSGPVMAAPPAQNMQQQPQQPQQSQSPPMWNGAPQQWPGSAMQPPGPYGAYPQPYPGYPPPGYPQGYPQPYPQPYPPPGYPAQPPYQYSGSRSRLGLDEDDRGGRRGARFFDDSDDKEKKELERRLQQADLDRKELEYKQALERNQTAHEQAMAAMREEIRRLGEGRNKNEDAEVQRLREEREQERQRVATEQAQMQRQLMEQQLLAMRQSHEQSMAALRAEIARFAEAAPKGESDELRRIREEQERMRQDAERQRQESERRLEMERSDRERERERHERERRDEMLQREMKETREATERRFEQMQMQGRQTDPVVEMMKESARLTADSNREIARMQAESQNRMSAFMVPPVQLAQIMKDNSSGSDGMIRGIIQSVGEIGNLYKNAAETIMQMSGGGGDPPAARLIQEGIGRASEVAERFLAVKRDQVISEGKVKTAEAQRDTTRIQAEAALRSQAMAVQQGRPMPGWAPPPAVVQQGGGLGGAQQQQRPQQQAPQQQQPQQPQAAQPAANTNGQPRKPGPIDLAPEPAAQRTNGAIDPYPPPPPPPNSTGPSEEEVFGMALESVHRLRRGVAAGTLTPEKTVDAILQGVQHVVSNNLVIPAFVLFQQERWADFIDVMLPNAPTDFKHECVRIMTEDLEPDDGTAPPDDDAPDADASA